MPQPDELSPADAFKAAFLARCAADGLSPADAEGLLRKRADAASPLGLALAASKLPWLAAGLTGAVGFGGGYMGGKLVARSLDPGYDPKDVNNAELAEAYEDYAGELEAEKARLDAAAAAPPPRPRRPRA